MDKVVLKKNKGKTVHLRLGDNLVLHTEYGKLLVLQPRFNKYSMSPFNLATIVLDAITIRRMK